MRRSTSATGVPVSACFSANAICSSVNLLFFTAPLLPSGSHKTGKLAFKPDEKNGETSIGYRLVEPRGHLLIPPGVVLAPHALLYPRLQQRTVPHSLASSVQAASP